MTDVGSTIAPKSDQLNSDDLIQGPRTITVTAVKAGDKEQPIAVYFQGDDGKPYKPCKSMRRVMVSLWGSDGAAYVGRSMTLYRDPKVKWGGIEVGGIRISHMTHIPSDQTMALTESKAKRAPFTVRKMEAPAGKATTSAKANVTGDAKPPGDLPQALSMLATADKGTVEGLLTGLRGFTWTKEESKQIKEAADKVNAKTVTVEVDGEEIP